MHIRTFGGVAGFALQVMAGVATVLWPQQIWIAWSLFWASALLILGTFFWWLLANYRVVWPFIPYGNKAPDTATPAPPARDATSKADAAAVPPYKRPLSTSEVEQRLIPIDLALTVLRDDMASLIDGARQLNNGWKAAIERGLPETSMQALADFKGEIAAVADRLGLLERQYRHFDDIAALLRGPRTNKLSDGVGALYSAIKATTRGDREWFINPYADRMREGVTETENWRRETEEKFIELRKRLSP